MRSPLSAPLTALAQALCWSAVLVLFAVSAAGQDPQAPQAPPTPPAQSPGASSQQTPGANEPVVVTASRTAQDPFDAPRAIDLLTSEYLERGLFRSTPQSLRYLPSTMIQETAPGQGSPYLRGFTGYNNLLLIDGIRLNNSTFRSGPNQYWSTIDPLSLDRIEVLRGPASTLYGSDAIGGTVQVFTKSPDRYGASGVQHGGGLFGRYADAEDSTTARGEFHAGITREGGLRTGFLHQEYAQNNVPRTHATIFGESWNGTTVGTDLQRDLDQTRRLTYVQLHQTGMGGLVEAVHLSASWQTQRELEERTPATGAQRAQAFEVGTFGAFAQFESDAGPAGRITWGVDWYHDNVNSWFRREGTPVASDPIQGQVANDASYDLLGAFVQDELPLGDRLAAQVGVRYTYAAVDAESVRDPAGNKFAIKDHWDEMTANAHLRASLLDGWNLYGGVSQGFRAPSLSDLSSFDVARSGEQEVPTPGLDEEHYVGYEIGTKVRADGWSGQLAYYYTDIEDQILRFPTGAVNGSGQPIVTKANVGEGYVEGIELQYAAEVLARLTFFGVNSWQYGRVSNFNNNGTARGEEFVSRLMPFTTVVGLTWEDVAGRFHATTEVVRAEDADKTSAGDNRDTQRIPPGGTPGYTIWNLRCGWQMDERASLELACENVTDVDYRVHGSGSNGLGRNFVVGMRVVF